MAISISRSVGKAGSNVEEDVVAVKGLLVDHGFSSLDGGGTCGKPTLQAIESFQRRFMSLPDGRVDPNGTTLRHLNEFKHHPHTVPSPFTRPVAKPPSSSLNVGVTPVSNDFMFKTLGSPRSSFSDKCQPITEAKLKRNVASGRVGTFKVTGLAPAIDSLQDVFSQIEYELPDLHALIGTAGMLCCRFVRGSTKFISNHSWGTAVDLTIDGVLDVRGDKKVQMGLTLIAPIFNSWGWYWGAAFPTEDGMHFEAGKHLVERFAKSLT